MELELQEDRRSSIEMSRKWWKKCWRPSQLWRTATAVVVFVAAMMNLESAVAFSPVLEACSFQRHLTSLHKKAPRLSVHRVGSKATPTTPPMRGQPTNTSKRRSKSRSKRRKRGKGAGKDQSQEIKSSQKDANKELVLSIQRYRKVLRIRDQLTETNEKEPAESEWAKACGFTIWGLRHVILAGQKAQDDLVETHEGLVKSIAGRYHRFLKRSSPERVGIVPNIHDLMQEGTLGLLNAAELFDTERGVQFSTYAHYWIRQRVVQFLTNSSRIVRLPLNVLQTIRKIHKTKRMMTLELGKEPSEGELAKELGMTESMVRLNKEWSQHTLSLETPLNPNGAGGLNDRRTIGDLVVSDAPSQEDEMQKKALQEDVDAVVRELPEREQKVVTLRFGLQGGVPLTTTQTAERLGVSTSRIRALEASALHRLRKPQARGKLKAYVNEKETDLGEPAENDDFRQFWLDNPSIKR